MDFIISIVVVAAFIVVVLWALYSFVIVPARRDPMKRKDKRPAGPNSRTCPLCKTVLVPGELVKSAVFPGKKDKMTHIFGCPHCYPPNLEDKRVCPVCLKEVPRDGYVIARMFETPGRKHVHVLGCTGCRIG